MSCVFWLTRVGRRVCQISSRGYHQRKVGGSATSRIGDQEGHHYHPKDLKVDVDTLVESIDGIVRNNGIE